MNSTVPPSGSQQEAHEAQAETFETIRLQDIVPQSPSSFSSSLHHSGSEYGDDNNHFEPIQSKATSAPTGTATPTPTTGGLVSRTSSSQSSSIKRELTNDDLRRVLSRRYTTRSSAAGGENDDPSAEWAEVQKLMSRMFGRERQENSLEEKTRHVGVVWKNLTVKGTGLGAALQPTNGDIFLAIPRLVKGLLTRGREGAGRGKPPIRTILNDFTVSPIFLRDLFGLIRKLTNSLLNFSFLLLGMCSAGRNASCPR